MNFKLLEQLITELNVSNSTLDKIKTLSKPEYNDEFVKGVLKATHNPFKQYYVTPKNLKKKSNLVAPIAKYADLFDLLRDLNARKITGYEAISEVNAFILNNKEFEEIIYNIFDRNLKTRVSEKIINKVFNDLVPTFDVALANKFDEKMALRVSFKDAWYASRKLDGLRCFGIIDEEGVIKMCSRSGNEFLTLDVVKDALHKLNLKGVVFDGEIYIIDDEGNENFQAILKEYNKKDHTILKPRYKLFDLIDLKDFENRKGKIPLSHRYDRLKMIMNGYVGDTLTIVEQWKVESGEHLSELIVLAEKNKWEGIMIRKDIPYEGKRSNNLLKCKKMQDAEYVVKGVDIGPFRVIIDGVEVTEEVLRNVDIEHKGFKVGVGSGFSLSERRYFKEHPEEIIGKEITVQYFEETKNQNGEISLRFPVVKAIYKNKRDV